MRQKNTIRDFGHIKFSDVRRCLGLGFICSQICIFSVHGGAADMSWVAAMLRLWRGPGLIICCSNWQMPWTPTRTAKSMLEYVARVDSGWQCIGQTDSHSKIVLRRPSMQTFRRAYRQLLSSSTAFDNAHLLGVWGCVWLPLRKGTFLVLCDLGTVAKFEMPCSNPNHHSFGGSFVPVLFHLIPGIISPSKTHIIHQHMQLICR